MKKKLYSLFLLLILFSVGGCLSKEKEEEFLRFAPSYALKVVKIGEVAEKDMRLDGINLSSEKLKGLYFDSFKKIVEQDL